MRYIPTSRLKPGMALGQDIYDGASLSCFPLHTLYGKYPAVPSKEFARQVVYVKRLPELTRTVKALEREIEALKEQLKNK